MLNECVTAAISTARGGADHAIVPAVTCNRYHISDFTYQPAAGAVPRPIMQSYQADDSDVGVLVRRLSQREGAASRSITIDSINVNVSSPPRFPRPAGGRALRVFRDAGKTISGESCQQPSASVSLRETEAEVAPSEVCVCAEVMGERAGPRVDGGWKQASLARPIEEDQDIKYEEAQALLDGKRLLARNANPAPLASLVDTLRSQLEDADVVDEALASLCCLEAYTRVNTPANTSLAPAERCLLWLRLVGFSASIIEMLVRILPLHANHAQVVERALGCLARLSALNGQNRRLLTDSGGIALLASAMAQHRGRAAIQAEASMALAALCCNGRQNCCNGCAVQCNKDRLRTAGALNSALLAMEAFPQNSGLQASVCYLIFRASGRKEANQSLLAKLGAFELLVAALDRAASNASQPKTTFTAGWASHDSSRGVSGGSGAGWARVAETATAALTQLVTNHERNLSHLAAHPVVLAAMARVMRAYAASPRVQKHACKALSLISTVALSDEQCNRRAPGAGALAAEITRCGCVQLVKQAITAPRAHEVTKSCGHMFLRSLRGQVRYL